MLIKLTEEDISMVVKYIDGTEYLLTAEFLNNILQKQYDTLELEAVSKSDIEIARLKKEVFDLSHAATNADADYEELKDEYESLEKLIEEFRTGEDEYIRENDILETKAEFYEKIIEKLVQ